MPRISRAILSRVLGVAILLCTSALAAKHFVMPTANAGKTYPAHDEHTNEGVTVGLDPYDLADKASIFSIPFGSYGFMPIFVVITNDGDQPVSLTNVTPELVTHDRTKIPRASEDDIYRRIAHAPSDRRPTRCPGRKKPRAHSARRRRKRFRTPSSLQRPSNRTARNQASCFSMCPEFQLRWRVRVFT